MFWVAVLVHKHTLFVIKFFLQCNTAVYGHVSVYPPGGGVVFLHPANSRGRTSNKTKVSLKEIRAAVETRDFFICMYIFILFSPNSTEGE